MSPSLRRSSTSGSPSAPSSRCSAPAPKSGGGASWRPSCLGTGVTDPVPITTTRSAPRSMAGLIGVFRRVPPSTYQPAAAAGRAHPHRREQDRDRRRRAHVRLADLGGDVVDHVGVACLASQLALDERDRLPAARRRRHHPERAHRAVVEVAVHLRPVDPGFQVALQRRGVEQALQADPRNPRQAADKAQRGERQALDDGPDDGRPVHLSPALQLPLDRLPGGQVGRRGEGGRVDGPDARPHEDRGPLSPLLERRQQHRQDAHLVGAPRPAAREDQRRLFAAAHRGHSSGWPGRHRRSGPRPAATAGGRSARVLRLAGGSGCRGRNRDHGQR